MLSTSLSPSIPALESEYCLLQSASGMSATILSKNVPSARNRFENLIFHWMFGLVIFVLSL